MRYTGINMSNVRRANRSSVLYLLNENGELSRKDIAEILGLTPAAVTKICSELLAEEAIIETGEVDDNSKAGRKKIMLSLNTDRIFALAVSIESDSCYIGICSLDGTEIISKTLSGANGTAEDYLEHIGDECNALIKKSEITRKRIIGAGIGVVGSVDREKGLTVGNYGMWRQEIAVGSIFEKKLNMPVVTENNVKAFAAAELIYDKNPAQNILFVKWGPRVGSAVVIGGEVFSGNDNSAGEIGHYIIQPNGKQCRCGRKGCLETHVSAQAIVDRIKDCYSKENMPYLFEQTGGKIENITFDMIMKSSQTDKCVTDIIDRRIDRMARAVVNAATIVGPDRVVLFGYMFNKSTTEKFTGFCKKYYNKYDEKFVSVSSIQNKSDYIGPLAVTAKYMFFEREN